MPQFESLECKTRLQARASQAEAIRDLCCLRLPSRSQSATWVRPGIAHSRHAAPDRTAAPRWRAGWSPGASARSSLDASSSTHETGSKSNALPLTLPSPQVQALSTRVPGISDEAVRRRRASPNRAAATVARAPGFRRGASSARTGPPDQSSHFALGGRPRTDVTPFERRG